MKTRDWIVLVAGCAMLPWLAIQLVSLTSEHAPVFLSLIDEKNSRTAVSIATHVQSQFENLVFAVPAGAFFAWAVRGQPASTAFLVVAGYSLAWISWNLFDDVSLSGAFESLIFAPHLAVLLLLGLNVYIFGIFYQRRRKVVA